LHEIKSCFNFDRPFNHKYMPRTEAQFGEIRELFANEGYYPTSISRIAVRAGISKGLMYNYFESKEDLILAIIGKGIATLTESMDPNHDGFMTEEEFEYHINENFRILQEHLDYWKLYFSTMIQPAVFKLVKVKYSHFLPPLKTVMTDYFERKGIPDPVAEADYFDAMLDGIFLNYVMNPDDFPLEKMRTLVIERFR
jgi:AcrR family transcriptional regulator